MYHKMFFQEYPYISCITRNIATLHEDIEVSLDSDFLEIKREIAKIVNTDFSLIKRLSIKFLSIKANDIRVAGYLVLSSCFLDEIMEVAANISAYNVILQLDNVFPKKNIAKVNALKWLNNPMILQFLNNKIISAKSSSLDCLKDAINQLNTNILQVNCAKNFKFNILNDNITGAKRKLKLVEQQSSKTTVKNSKVMKRNNCASKQASITPKCKPNIFANANADRACNNDFSSTIKQFINEFLLKKNFSTAIHLARILRWSNLKIEADKHMRTSLAALPLGSKSKLHQAIGKNENSNIISIAEKLFIMPGGHLTLELQYYILAAAKNLEKIEIIQTVEFWINFVLRKYPEISRYRFRDNTLFAAKKIQNWLKQFETKSNHVTCPNMEHDVQNIPTTNQPSILANFIFL